MKNLDYIRQIIISLKADASAHKRIYSEDAIKLILTTEIILEEYEKNNLNEFFETEFISKQREGEENDR